MHSIRFAFVLALVAAGSAYAANQFGPWSDPVPVRISTCTSGLIPAVSKDGRSLYVAQSCSGNFDLFVSQLDDQTGDWGPLQPLWMLNTSANDQAPAFTRDGHFMYFVSTRSGGKGLQDIWMSYREQTHDDFAWQPPVEVPELSTSDNEGGPALFEDEHGQHMILQMRQGHTNADFYASDLMADGTWTAPVRIAELSDPAAQDQRPTIRFDGLEVIFESSRGGTPDLWFSTRETTDGTWATPEKLPFNTTSYDGFPYLSGDGNTLYFYSNRGGTPRIWMTTRERGNSKK